MNITVPVSWLRDYLKTDIAAKTLANSLSLSGPSVEKIRRHGTDLLMEIEVTGNRPDAFSIFGLAREAHAILSFQNAKSALTAPKGLDTRLDPDTKNILSLDVLIRDKSLCPRFTAIILSGVKIGPSPAEIRNKLEAAGIRPINNIVDITNYVMLELGQPMHAFDFDKIKGAKMTLRPSKAGQKIKTLDGQTRILPAGAIVIEDSQKLVDLCGIMGAANSQISRRTKRVLLFVQAYDSLRIRKTTQALALRTDAAVRFEKGIDLEGILPALSRAVYLA
ncbi:phenylalanine--tRNA ligase subunit beta, partial [Candidatus Curtissbacteria bacterium]|nr:phenylalanine--tRNA ligase subunit beta [Candidatus Curtissbacteria bacterium]